MGKRARKFFLTYIAFSAVTVLIATAAYVLSYRVIRDAAIESGRRDLDFSRRLLDNRINDLYTSVAQLANGTDTSLVARIERPLPYPNYYDILHFQESLPLFNLTSTFIDDVYVYFYESGVLVSTTQIVVRTQMYYDNFFVHGDWSFGEWEHWIRSSTFRRRLLPAMSIGPAGAQTQMVRFLESFPLDTIRPRGVIMVYVDETAFVSYLNAINTGSTGFLAVLDDQNRVIAAAGELETLDRYIEAKSALRGGRFVTLEDASQRYPFRLVAAIPTAIFFDQVNLVGYVFLAIIGLEIVVGFLLARYFAIRDMRPIRELLQAVSDAGGAPELQDEFSMLAASFESMVEDNNALQETIERRTPVIQSSFVEQLLSGKFESDAEVESARRLARLSFEHEHYAVCVISVVRQAAATTGERQLSGQPILRAMLEESFRKAISVESYPADIEPEATAFLLNLSGEQIAKLRSIIEPAVDTIRASLGPIGSVRVVVSASGVGSSISEVSALYSQAKTIHDYQLIMGESGPILYSDMKHHDENRAVFDLEMEIALSRSVVAGNEEKTHRVLAELRRSVEAADDLTPHAVELVLNQLEGALLRIKGALIFGDVQLQKVLQTHLDEARRELAFHERLRTLEGVFIDLCKRAQNAVRTRQDRVFSEMQAFLAQRCSDPLLGLNVLADEFGFSPGYASRFFKENAGVGMAEYLERLRIERAAERLKRTKESVGDIAVAVGYAAPNTFYKAFRRLMGVSPGEYRQRNHGSSVNGAADVG